ncbi:MAG TPA: hypothetical protein VIW24_08200 [Aldersonia sp.]
MLRPRRDLAEQVGLDPAPRRCRWSARSGSPTRPPPTADESAIFGRADAALDRAWRASTRGLTVVDVRGPGGIGKAALIDDALRRHRSADLSGVGGGAPLQTPEHLARPGRPRWSRG